MPYYQYRYSLGSGFTPVIKNLMIAMGAVFVIERLLNGFIIYYFALVPFLVRENYFFWQLGTYIFLHGGLTHLLFNLLGLWMFGGELENYWGGKRFLVYFLLCGIGAGLCTVLFTPGLYQRIPVVGASGSIYGVLLAFAWLFPNRPVFLLFFPVPIAAKYMVILYGLIELFASMEGPGSGVAHITHLGGLAIGFFYMLYPSIRQRIRCEYYRRKWSRPDPRDKNRFRS
jgi:membrane associated rhomboid family serine protease